MPPAANLKHAISTQSAQSPARNAVAASCLSGTIAHIRAYTASGCTPSRKHRDLDPLNVHTKGPTRLHNTFCVIHPRRQTLSRFCSRQVRVMLPCHTMVDANIKSLCSCAGMRTMHAHLAMHTAACITERSTHGERWPKKEMVARGNT